YVFASLHSWGDLWGSGNWSGAFEAKERTLAAARELGDPDLLFRIAGWFVSPGLAPAHNQVEQLAVVDELKSRSREGVGPSSLGLWLTYCEAHYLVAGQPDLAGEARRELLDLANRAHD